MSAVTPPDTSTHADLLQELKVIQRSAGDAPNRNDARRDDKRQGHHDQGRDPSKDDPKEYPHGPSQAVEPEATRQQVRPDAIPNGNQHGMEKLQNGKLERGEQEQSVTKTPQSSTTPQQSEYYKVTSLVPKSVYLSKGASSVPAAAEPEEGRIPRSMPLLPVPPPSDTKSAPNALAGEPQQVVS